MVVNSVTVQDNMGRAEDRKSSQVESCRSHSGPLSFHTEQTQASVP